MTSTNNTLEIKGCRPQEDTQQFDKTSWVIAVGLAIFAAFINNFGLNLQKLAWRRQQAGNVSPHVYRFYWVVGMILIVMASVCDFVALAFGPQSVIAPLGSLTMVANGIIAPMMHGEKLHKQVLLSTAIIVVGCAMSVAAASHDNNVCDIDSLFALYWTGRFFLYALVLGCIIGSVYWFIKKAEGIRAEYGPGSPEYMRVFQYHRISYAGISGIFGAQSVLFARTVSQLFVGSARGGRVFLLYPGTYAVVFCLVACIVAQIYFLNQGLARFESLYNVPIFTSTWIVGTVLGGGIFYGEFASFSLTQALLFPLGIIICCVGVFLLSRGNPDDHRVDVGGDGEGGAGGMDEHTPVGMDESGASPRSGKELPGADDGAGAPPLRGSVSGPSGGGGGGGGGGGKRVAPTNDADEESGVALSRA